MPQVQVIQPIQQQPKRLRVAAYARVSTKSNEQLHSMSVQTEYYEDLIQKNPNWEFVGVYADEGISGTSIKHRAELNRLMEDCRAGMIDRILVKSASRMNNMRIVEIPASMRESAGRKNTVRKLRVVAYCRVSTEEEEQQGSFEIQKLYYTEKINSTPEWEVAGIYADDGISGVHTKKRDGFNQMIQDCKKRKIDLILTKSISRFARNTLDSIQ